MEQQKKHLFDELYSRLPAGKNDFSFKERNKVHWTRMQKMKLFLESIYLEVLNSIKVEVLRVAMMFICEVNRYCIIGWIRKWMR
jgi:hypothetical protein